jgi:hypothetical protein
MSTPMSNPEVKGTCCTKDQVKPLIQVEAQKPEECTKTVSPCVECDGGVSQPCCDGELAHINNQN